MTRHVWLLTCALTAVTPLAVSGQEPLTLDRAVAATLAQNATLRAARAGAGEARESAAEARSAFYPRVSFAESWQGGNQPVFVFGSLLSARHFAAENFALDALNHPEATGLFRASVSIEQLVFDGGGQRASADAASLRRDIATLAVDERAADLVLAATRTFGRILAAQAAHDAAAAGVTSAREDLARAERRRDAGLATDADVLALVVHLADLQHRAIQSEGDAAVARAELNRLMGAPIQQTFQAVAPMDDIAGPAPDATALLEEAGRARPELRRAEAARRLSDAVRKQARAALMPRLFATAVVDASGTQFDDRASAWIAGGEVRWTFSAGGAERARQKAAVEAAARASAESDDVRLAVQVDVITALSRLNAARAREAAGRSSVEQARESQRIVRDRFEAGMAGVTDVLRASTARLEAEANRVSALVDTMVSGAMLRRAVGRTP